MNKQLLIFIIIVNLLLPYTAISSTPVQEGDKAFLLMQYEEAVNRYRLDSLNPDAQWRMARAYICLGDVSSGEKKQKLIYKAEKAARTCLYLNERNSNGHTWLAVALGSKAMYEGSRAKVALCNEIKKELERALELNPKDDLSYSVLGTFYRALGKISWFERTLAETFLGGVPRGGFKESEAALNKAISISSDTMRHWYELALLYQDWNKKEEKVKAFRMVSELKVQVAGDKKRLKHSKGELLNHI